MSIAEEIEKLQALHDQGALTDDEFAQAKAALLDQLSDGQSASDVDELSKEVQYLRMQKEIDRLNLKWEQERQGYKNWDPRGRSRVSTILGFVIGIPSIISGVSQSDGLSYVLSGLLLVSLGLMGGIHWFNKVSAYKKAEQRYQERRREIRSRRTSDPYGRY
ncbi:MAG TPA: SHOCT domain-containing protein [Herpetosiphonaceae bacterium]